jgi:hypothetical protein
MRQPSKESSDSGVRLDNAPVSDELSNWKPYFLMHSQQAT